jgi:hypothetical protein
MKPNPVGWFEIYVDDMDRARAFYEAVFGTSLQPLPVDGVAMLAFPMGDGPGAGGALVHMPGMPAGRNSTLVYFTCDDCQEEGARVEAAGGRVLRPKMSIGEYGYVVLAYDTEGNLIGLHSMR